MNAYSQIDYLVIGHVSRDIVPGGYVPGGTAIYSALAAQALGCRVAMITSVDPSYDIDSLLAGITVRNVVSEHTTTFENTYEGSSRRQSVFSVARVIQSTDVPTAWQRAPLVHLGPIVGEIEAGMIRLFSNSIIGVTPQGWFRRWKDDGQVYIDEWPDASTVLPLASAVITSLEDLPGPEHFERMRQWAQLLVLTHGDGGCTVYSREEERLFPAPAVDEVNPTGAGDIFATAFLVRFYQTNGNPWEAAEFANQVAARSVAENDLKAKTEAIRQYAQHRL